MSAAPGPVGGATTDGKPVTPAPAGSLEEPASRATRWKIAIEAAISSDVFKIIVLLFILYMITVKTMPVSDTQSSNWMPWLILRKGTLGFNYMTKNLSDYIYFPHNGTLFTTVPPGSSLLALPVYLIPSLFISHPTDFAMQLLGKVSAAAMMAVAAAFIYLAARRLWDRRAARILTIVFALGTGVFSMASQQLINFTGSLLCLSVGVYLLVRGNSKKGYLLGAGFAFAFAGLCQPINLLILAVFGLYVLRRRFRDVYTYALGALAPVLFLLAYNWHCFGSPLKNGEPFGFGFMLTGSWAQAVKVPYSRFIQTPIYKGLPGQLISPSRGIFFFSPILLFAFYGLYLVWRKKTDSILVYGLLACVPPLIVSGMWTDWIGGNSYGYRITLSAIPFLVLALGPTIREVWASKALKIIFIVLLVFSIFVQVVGYISYDGGSWERMSAIQAGKIYAPDNPNAWSLTKGQLVWEITHFNFYQPTLWQELVHFPNRSMVTRVTRQDLGDKVRIRVTVSTPQITRVNAMVYPGSSIEDQEALPYGYRATVPRGKSTFSIIPDVPRSVGDYVVVRVLTNYAAIEDGRIFDAVVPINWKIDSLGEPVPIDTTIPRPVPVVERSMNRF
jgi:hypothetical protein